MSLGINPIISRTFTQIGGGIGAGNVRYDPGVFGARVVSRLAPRHLGNRTVFPLRSGYELGAFRNGIANRIANRSLAFNIGYWRNGRNVATNPYPAYYNREDPRLYYNSVLYPNGYPGGPIAQPELLVYGNGRPYLYPEIYGATPFSYNPNTYALPLTTPDCAPYIGAASIADPVLCRDAVIRNGGTARCATQICGYD